ncbi:MAG: hypothetical protein M3442_20375 [Chloroflexota bacterium]|nr:hypothetical protein [Chloroflexota bacterium]
MRPNGKTKTATGAAAIGVLTGAEVAERLFAELAHAEWVYDPEIDELELFLPQGAGRPGVAELVGDDVYVRLDVETRAPLSVIVSAWTSWLEEQGLPVAASPTRSASPDAPAAMLPTAKGLDPRTRRVALEGLVRYLRAHQDDLAHDETA